MRTLIITHLAPLHGEQSVEGVFKRLRMFVNALSRISDRIEFLCIVVEEEVAAYEDILVLNSEQSAYWGVPVEMTLVPIARRHETFLNHYLLGMFRAFDQPDLHHYASSEPARHVAEKLATRPDLVFVFQLAAMGAVLRSGITPARMFFDLNDVAHRLRLRTALEPPFWLGKIAYLAHAPALLVAEWRAARRSRALFVCSDDDRRHLRRFGFGSKVMVVPNALPMPSHTERTLDPTVMLLGSFSYKPNQDAAERLIQRIWPLVLAQVPNARLIIAGKDPERIAAFRHSLSNVEFTGFVPDLDALYARVRVVVCPLIVGGGTRIKLIEGGSYGKPMVSTRIGAEGLNLADGIEILLRDDDRSFADACVRLLRDDALCDRLGMAAKSKVAALYDAAHIERRIAAIMSSDDRGSGRSKAAGGDIQ